MPPPTCTPEMSESEQLSKTAPAPSSHDQTQHEACMTLPATIQWLEFRDGAEAIHHLDGGGGRPELVVYETHLPPSALFKIRIPVAGRSRRSKTKSMMFLVITPNIISKLCWSGRTGPPTSPETEEEGLHFELTGRAILVGPHQSMFGVHPSQRAAFDTIDTLARQDAFEALVAVNEQQKERLNGLLQAHEARNLASISPTSQMPTFYRGHGFHQFGPDLGLYDYYGKGKGKDGPRTAPNEADLPSYDDTEPAPPPSHSSGYGCGSKRKKAHSPSSTGSSCPDPPGLGAMEAMCRKIFAEEQASHQRMIEAEVSKVLAHIVEDVLPKEASKIESSILNVVQTKLDALREELVDTDDDLQRQLYDLEHQVTDTISLDIDDGIAGGMISLQGFVKDELREAVSGVEQRIRRGLTNASLLVPVDFNDY